MICTCQFLTRSIQYILALLVSKGLCWIPGPICEFWEALRPGLSCINSFVPLFQAGWYIGVDIVGSPIGTALQQSRVLKYANTRICKI